ncbi:MAG: FadR family transcriptional regulator [Myxococcales bacterium]|nr:FadR family transcriptional regulator [Myxococcales bacterium]
MSDLQPIARQSVADAVYGQLRDRILAGELAPGEALPGERRLAEIFGVNRGAVREGLQRLAQARLVAVHHGGATRVLDYRDAGLDLLSDLLARPGAGVDLALVQSILEMRNALAPIIAGFAARRGGAELAATLAPLVEALAAAPDDAARYLVMRDLWQQITRGCGNLALRLALNSLQQGTGQHEAQARMVLQAELTALDAWRDLVSAIGAGDAPAAEAAARALVAPTIARGERLLALLSPPRTP